MDDRVDAFARLNRLRAQGILTDAEYDREKATLMGGDVPHGLSFGERWAAAWEATSDMRRSLRWWFLGCVIVIGLIGTYFFGKAASIAEARGELAGPAVAGAGETPTSKPSEEASSLLGADSPWTIETTTDPMTDATVSKASAKFEGNQFDIEVVASCSSAGDIRYTAASFDKDGQPAEMRSTPGYNGAPGIDYQLRADNKPAWNWATYNPPYNNQITITTAPVGSPSDDMSGIVDNAEQVAQASKVVLRLAMTTGEETIEWSQGGSLRNMLAPCVSQRQATRERLASKKAAVDREAAAERARQPTQVVQTNAM